MKRITLYLIIGFLAFTFGVWFDLYAREPRQSIPDCNCTSVQCRVLVVADHPDFLLRHPVETWRLMLTARWRDGW